MALTNSQYESIMRGYSEQQSINRAELGKRYFLIDGGITIEVGGKDKSFEQVAGLPNSYIMADRMEYAVGKKIPLWLAGMLY